MSEKGIAIITGASKGIGYCVAKGLAIDGYKTILIARDAGRLECVSKEIAKSVSDELSSCPKISSQFIIPSRSNRGR
jgi:short-subunit dehydrogenase